MNAMTTIKGWARELIDLSLLFIAVGVIVQIIFGKSEEASWFFGDVIYSTLYVPPAHLTGPGSKAAEPRIGASTAHACALWVYGHSSPPSVGQTLDITPAKTNRLAPVRLIPQHCKHGSGPTKAGLALRILHTRSMAHSDLVQGRVLTTSHGRGLGDSRYKCDAWDAGIRGLTQSIRQEMLLVGLNHENGRASCCGTPRLRWPSEYC
jgi:hypothetical protein